MYPKRFFCARAFAPRFFPPVPPSGTTGAEKSAGRRIRFGEEYRSWGAVSSEGIVRPNAKGGGVSRGKVKRGT